MMPRPSRFHLPAALAVALAFALAASAVVAGPLPVARAVLRGHAKVTYPTGLGVEQQGGTLLLMEHATLRNEAAESIISLRNGDRLALGHDTALTLAEGPRVGVLAGGVLFHLDATNTPTSLRLAGYLVERPEAAAATSAATDGPATAAAATSVSGIAGVQSDGTVIVEALEQPVTLRHPDGRLVTVPARRRYRLAAVGDASTRIVLTQLPTDADLGDEAGVEEDDDDDEGLLLGDEATGEEAGLLFGLGTTTVVVTGVVTGVTVGGIVYDEVSDDDNDDGDDNFVPRGPVSIIATQQPTPTPEQTEPPFDEARRRR